MINRTIITIGRQFGSGGRLIGQKLAALLDIPFYDKQLIALAAEKTGVNSAMLQKADEQATNYLFYSSILDSYGLGGLSASAAYQMPVNDQLFIAQSDIIRELADNGPCVIIGRCANYILKDNPNCLNLFFKAPIGDRVNRALEEYQMEASHIEDTITKIDKRRATYYNYYADNRWGKTDTYDFILNSSVLGMEATSELIAQMVNLKEKPQF